MQARWTQFSVFEHSDLEFDIHTFLNRPAVPDAQDIWRFGFGVQYEVFTGITLLTGFAWEGAGVKALSLTPLFFDTDEYMIGAGITIERSRWQLTVGSGVSFNNSRRVGTKKNPFFPGRYSLDWTPFGVQLTRKFDMEI